MSFTYERSHTAAGSLMIPTSIFQTNPIFILLIAAFSNTVTLAAPLDNIGAQPRSGTGLFVIEPSATIFAVTGQSFRLQATPRS